VNISVAVLEKKGGNAVETVLTVLEALQAERGGCFEVATPSKLMAEESINKLRAHKAESTVASGYAGPKALPCSLPKVTKLGNSPAILAGTTYLPAKETSPLQAISQHLHGNCCAVAEAFVKDVEGDFSLTVVGPAEIVSARDPIGVQPLYYGETETLSALASNRKALWKLGVAEPKSFPPGHVAVTTKDGFKFTPLKTLTFQNPQSTTLGEAAEKLQTLLESSVQRRVFGVKKVAVAFSGGLDSSMVAFLAKKCGVAVQLVHVSLENQPETEEAWKAAEELDLPMQVHLFKESDIEQVISKVVWLVEEPDPVKASVGVPFFWTAEKTAETGFEVLLAGQGADELFGGYQRYIKEYLLEGDKKVRRTMHSDVVNIHESNIERDKKICTYHNVELRLPFASYELAQFAMSLPTNLKFEKKQDSLRKLVLRKAAENMGLSPQITQKPKKAVQYSTGINSALKKLAKKHNLTIAEYTNRLFTETKNK
jgi:asparagine synthase (glutamine-hydrolysing)